MGCRSRPTADVQLAGDVAGVIVVLADGHGIPSDRAGGIDDGLDGADDIAVGVVDILSGPTAAGRRDALAAGAAVGTWGADGNGVGQRIGQAGQLGGIAGIGGGEGRIRLTPVGDPAEIMGLAGIGAVGVGGGFALRRNGFDEIAVAVVHVIGVRPDLITGGVDQVNRGDGLVRTVADDLERHPVNADAAGGVRGGVAVGGCYRHRRNSPCRRR
jgi:hypothetical protein